MDSTAAPATQPPVTAGPEARAALHERVVAALKQIYDPEIPVNIYDLGLIYRVEITPEQHVHLDMTLTAPGCPVAQTFPGTVEQAISAVEGVSSAHVELVWEPPWTMDRMPDETKLQLGLL
jgi:FeS assembly SUF system protein